MNSFKTATRRPSSRHSNASFNQGSAVSTARRVSVAREPLAVDMSFGNGNSTVRQFRRFSSAGRGDVHVEEVPPMPTRASSNINSSFSSTETLIPETQNENTPPLTNSAPGTVARLTKESLMGRRAYVKAIDGAFQETHAQTGSQQKREALAKAATAWAALDRVDPEGEFLLLRNIVDRIQADPKLAAALGVAPSGMPNTPTASAPNTPMKSKAPAVLSPKTATSHKNDSFSSDSSNGSPNSPARNNSHGKRVQALPNPNIKSGHRRSQSAVSPVSSDRSSSNGSSSGGERKASNAIDEKKLPGYVKPGMEHASMLADVLYGRWTEGLAARWSRS